MCYTLGLMTYSEFSIVDLLRSKYLTKYKYIYTYIQTAK